MSGGNERERNRATRRFRPDQLAELTQEAAKPGDEGDRPRTPLGTTPPPDLAQSRTVTAHDPLTTVLLAEASRRSRTLELDPDEVDAVIEDVTTPDPDPAHPAGGSAGAPIRTAK